MAKRPLPEPSACGAGSRGKPAGLGWFALGHTSAGQRQGAEVETAEICPFSPLHSCSALSTDVYVAAGCFFPCALEDTTFFADSH